MFKVFEAEMTVNFSEVLHKNFPQSCEFASADGISGVVEFEPVYDGILGYRVSVVVKTELKRTFPDFESYLNLINTVLGGSLGITPESLKDIKTSKCLSKEDELEVLVAHPEHEICQDEDAAVIVRRIDNKLNIFVGSTLAAAEVWLNSRH